MTRSTQDVFDDHLRLADAQDVATDITRNFTADCVLLTGYGVFRGHAGGRDAAALLQRQLPDARFAYRTRMHEGEIAFLEWEAEASTACVHDGADSFLIRGGRIVVMTIHYTVQPKP